ncbi:choice-of-anchor L domain-containing protein, partial [Lacinutrix sp.]|uniref:choice-of-anchor L domain-containing protein n=1 Tax=Lacinutrix sp. TaxID=1937692 RepID=UPI0025C4BD8D
MLIAISTNAQNITVDSQTFTPQQLIEDILIDSNCITNVVVTETIGGDFGGADQSYGFFDATGTTFPFQSGIVLSTGRLSNVPGPNDNLSDDDAAGWIGDADLEEALQESPTFNATFIEFDFTSVANQISFRYIFASEEYQEGNSNTCNFSDLFGFLIKPVNVAGSEFENIALIPGTQTPVKVTTVHSGIPNACDPINETFFGNWNDSNYQPINFNGQTTILTATANIIPNTVYSVKLVIADEFNERFDSAVFMEAGSFELTTDLGPDRLLATNTPVCGTKTITLDATQSGTPTYRWFENGIEQTAQTTSNYNVTGTGTYNVEVTLDNGCVSFGEITIEYAPEPVISDTILFECDSNQDGLTTYNLFDASDSVTNDDPNLGILAFYNSNADADAEVNPIQDFNNFNNTLAMQRVYAAVVSQVSGCKAVAEIILDISTNTLSLQEFDTCDDAIVDGFSIFNLNEVITDLQPQIPANSTVTFYTNSTDAFSETNSISGNFNNTVANSQTIFVKVTTDTNQCYAISELTLNVLYAPQLLESETLKYCLNIFPETITLFAGVTNDIPENFTYQWLLNGTDTGIIAPTLEANEIGTYTVIASDGNGCSNTRDLVILASNEATIDNLQLTNNNTAIVTVSGDGDYEFAIDNAFGIYQDSNTFSNIDPGFHTIYVRDKNGCGNTSIEFSILGFPDFFTPNNDTFNDVWKPLGTSTDFNSNL